MSETEIRCADCGNDLTHGTGSLTHETSACPWCACQRFEKWERVKVFGPAVDP